MFHLEAANTSLYALYFAMALAVPMWAMVLTTVVKVVRRHRNSR